MVLIGVLIRTKIVEGLGVLTLNFKILIFFKMLIVAIFGQNGVPALSLVGVATRLGCSVGVWGAVQRLLPQRVRSVTRGPAQRWSGPSGVSVIWAGS